MATLRYRGDKRKSTKIRSNTTSRFWATTLNGNQWTFDMHQIVTNNSALASLQHHYPKAFSTFTTNDLREISAKENESLQTNNLKTH